ncbi:MAG: hypothetical protein JWN60_1942, partial [Acidobacteria bacterium]|nr:hypothetical protein [Acidobacteriota bacterium]
MKNYLNLRDLIVILISVAFITVFFIATNIFAQTPGVDVTFNPLLTKDVTENYTGNFALQPDGKILIYGAFQNSGTYLKRLNPDGTTDTSFNCALCNTITVFNAIVQPDGKILVAGLSSGAAIYRLNPDGSQDLTFNGTLPVAGSPFSNDVEAVAVQPDGKIIVRHTFSTGGFTEWDILRLNADGSIDGSFTKIALGGRLINTDYSRVALLPDGKIMTAGATISATSEPFLRRYNSNGTTDTTFETPAFNDGRRINYFDFYPDGSIIISGFFSGVNSVPRRDLVKLLPVGNVDLNFNGSAIFNTFNKHAGKVSVLPDGKVLVNTIDYNSLNPTNTNNRLYRLNPDGSIDTTFNVPADLTTAHNWTVDSSNRILVFGVFSGILKYLRLNADGSLDSSFNSPTLTKPGTVKALAVLTDGKILVSGDFNRVGGVIKNNIARLNADGTLDNSFDSGSGFNVAPVSIAIQTDGKILAAGSFTTYNGVSRSGAARLNSDGSLDNSFNVTAAQVNTIVA